MVLPFRVKDCAGLNGNLFTALQTAAVWPYVLIVSHMTYSLNLLCSNIRDHLETHILKSHQSRSINCWASTLLTHKTP